MFTGIIEELGTVTGVEAQRDALRLTVSALTVLEDVQLGDSIAVNGCCLTVVSTSPDHLDQPGSWTADVMQEARDPTTLGDRRVGDRVNLERAVTLDRRLGGHLVQRHVDAVGTVVARTPSEHWEVVEIALAPELSRYLVDKGSITVDGTSLTVVEAGADSFTVSLIPETLTRTTLGFRGPGDRVNLEVDVLAKYVERMVSAHLKESTHD
jgi:riboflavin synthase